ERARLHRYRRLWLLAARTDLSTRYRSLPGLTGLHRQRTSRALPSAVRPPAGTGCPLGHPRTSLSWWHPDTAPGCRGGRHGPTASTITARRREQVRPGQITPVRTHPDGCPP